PSRGPPGPGSWPGGRRTCSWRGWRGAWRFPPQPGWGGVIIGPFEWGLWKAPAMAKSLCRSYLGQRLRATPRPGQHVLAVDPPGARTARLAAPPLVAGELGVGVVVVDALEI